MWTLVKNIAINHKHTVTYPNQYKDVNEKKRDTIKINRYRKYGRESRGPSYLGFAPEVKSWGSH